MLASELFILYGINKKLDIIKKRDSSEMMEGDLPKKQKKLVSAWMEIHHEELVADWELAVSGEQPYKIDPLK